MKELQDAPLKLCVIRLDLIR